MTQSTPLRLAMIGGGPGSMIGAVHRFAARLDNQFELVAGVFSTRAEGNRETASQLRLDPDRCYDSYDALIDTEAARDDGARVVAITTPNHLHYPIALACIEAGLDVICEKPMTVSLAEAEHLAERVADRKTRFVLMHNYCGYPLVQHARDCVQRGDLGRIRSLQVEYLQEWLSEVPTADNKQADWRLDPKRAGSAGALGDIGTHAFQLACFISGLTPESVSAELTCQVPGRVLDDNVQAMLRFEGGATGMLWASQTAPGFENALRIRVVGDKASLEWAQENPNELWLSPLNQPRQRITRRDEWFSNATAASVRIPPGHPEGYLEGFANLYQALAADVSTASQGGWLPDVSTGVDGLKFIAATLRSNQNNGQWTSISNGVSS
ncbi:Gfo/Idh/MocA family protein [Saccharospirillum impatiens]|uniref:Gfo/Idh/MocA family protein n=1 Tax=Saccharospirillum impatiens TaxID=169438 RepID=UPI000407671C|nr:Gfo/Idh/MocA family oxidoreductase [Saccharospirillum impatiens]